jgi:crossover junction endodeoxyribonuclease RuvC
LKIVGIDPGISATGYGILEDGTVTKYGTIRPKKGKTYSKLSEICKEIERLISSDKPDLAVLEKVFHKKNIQSLLRSSELRGAIILTLTNQNIKIVEFTPAQIKLAITGNGRASKQQVRYFVERTMMQNNKKVSSDAIDALAIAYTGARKMHFQGTLLN